jgi:hypothetical protein
MLAIINTNQTSMVLPAVSELTRIKVFKWLHKTVTNEDRAVIPKHQLMQSHNGIFNYENKFLERFGGCLMMELLTRHRNLKNRSAMIELCGTVKEWTLMSVSPKTILSFLRECTESHDQTTEPESDAELDRLAMVHQRRDMDTPKEPSVDDLYVAYMYWRRKGVRYSPTDPTNLTSFRTHLEFYHPIARRHIGLEEEEYVEGIRLKEEFYLLKLMRSGGIGMIGMHDSYADSVINRVSARNSLPYSGDCF